ncbi:SurA N-terminal domain-containing protein [Kaistia dalseonensis]|uniref:Peptidyl-prolyl cis-trans isomerase SurA n=1 Tax=Kaistia dalseonensis TaxID=410840 RepID=A0ABU0H2P3_9HYPH|nr:SurA N-terminal domain-containing protein [Kaistia dalseonensis]MCX5493209.1 SurA N-terminal domain-containing protein [Kaistia dalseonensis]MDQ0435764.1 peptidyl-prolyl cis-trans isomerase SurA [Kaistia dalseonensis]
MRTMLRTLVFSLFSIGLGLALLPSVASAQSTIKATVNDQAITSYDVNQRVKLMALFHQKATPKSALDDLIDEAIVQQFATPRKMLPDEAGVNERYAAIAKQVKLPLPQFGKALQQAGVEPETLKKLFRAQMTWATLMRAKIRSQQSNVSEADIQAELAKEGVNMEQATMKEFKLQQIVFVVPKTSPPGSAQRRLGEAEAFRKRFPGCDGSLDLAKSLKGVVVINAGRRDTSQMDTDMADALSSTPAGGTLKPEITDRGVEVIAICSVKEIQSTAGVRAQVEKKLSAAQNQDIEKDFKAELRKNAKIVYN